MEPTLYNSCFELSQLPYFEERNGRLVLSEPLECPAVDVHAHLALSYTRRETVDLFAEHPETKHYLPLSNRLDLDIYINKNFTPADMEVMKKDLVLGAMRKKGLRATHTAPNLLREMKELGVHTSVLLPIDYPVLSWNAEVYLELASKTDGLISMGSVHPYAKDVGDKLEKQKQMGACGIKVHPAIQMLPPDNARAMELYGLCGELELPVLWHCGPVGIEPRLGRRFCQLKNYWRPVREFPGTTFVLGHSGALQFEMALELAQSHENAFLETSCQSVTNVRRIVDDAPPERVLFGSDWPFYHQALPLAKLLMATEHAPERRQGILWDNAARLFDLKP